MEDPQFELPPELQPLVDARQIASDLEYVFFLQQVSRGMISDEAEAQYSRINPEVFEPAIAEQLVETAVTTLLFDPRFGLVALAKLESTDITLGSLASGLFPLSGKSIEDIRTLLAALYSRQTELDSAYTQSMTLSGYEEIGDLKYKMDANLLIQAQRVLTDLITISHEGIKEAVFSGVFKEHQDALFQFFSGLFFR